MRFVCCAAADDVCRITFVTGEFLLSLIARLKDYDDAVTTVGDIILTLVSALSYR